MHSASYEITALIARYFLIFLSALVLLRSIFIARAARPKAAAKNLLQIAKLTCLDTEKDYFLGYDNTVGSSNRCDIQISGRGVGKIHIQIYKKKSGWMLCTYSNKSTLLNEIKVNGSIPISTNDVIRLGAQRFRFEAEQGGDA